MDFYGQLGLEAEIYYNGLLINQRWRAAGSGPRYKITDLGGLDDADVRDAREPNPMRDGELALPAYYGGRTITLTGRIMARNVAEMRTMQSNLKKAFAALQETPLQFYNDGTATSYVYINARKSAPIQMRESQQNQFPTRDFLITLRASDPRFYSAATSTFAITGSSLATTYKHYNSGWATSDPVIRINGPLVPTNVGTYGQSSIVNITAGQALTLIYDRSALTSASSFVEINTARRTVTGSTGTLNYSNVLAGSLFPQIVGGTNTFWAVGLTGTGNVRVNYQSAWL